ncbi:MAG: M1 family metallopeptidase, partial [Candidatus Limnocylindria bacterium]
MTEEKRNFRLSREAWPRRYELHFDLDLDRWTAAGRARIALRLDRAAREIVLHAVDIDITAARIDGGPALESVAYDAEAETATLRFTAEVAAGERVMAIEWAGAIRDSLRGLYRSTRGDERYAATQFEAADARRAFPCFDEPEYKARFALDLVHPAGLTALANAPLASSEDLGGGRRRTRFAETPPISSYLVAFTVGPYEATEATATPSGVPVRVWL